MSLRAFVTGATGFVGSNIVSKLVQEGWQVDVVTRPSSDLEKLGAFLSRLNVCEYDGDVFTMIDLMERRKPDVVFHVASLFLSDHDAGQIDRLINSNIVFGVHLLEAMSKVGVRDIVNTGTSWEHYNNKHYSPVNLYAATKRAFWDLLQFYVEARGIRAITLKLFDTYGPNDIRPKLLNKLIKGADVKGDFAMSPGKQKIDLVHITDVVEAYMIAAKKLLAGEVEGCRDYFVKTGTSITIQDLVEVVEKKVGKKINVQWGGRPYRDREVMVPAECGENILDARGHTLVTIENGIDTLFD